VTARRPRVTRTLSEPAPPDTTPPGAALEGQARPAAGLLGRPLVISDRGRIFAIIAALVWLGLVALPFMVSLALHQPASGLPLLGVVAWLVFLRTARWLSPPARADRLLRQGRYVEALAMCDGALAITGGGAWAGRRRLIWLNRRVAALLGIGRYDEALVAALRAVEESADPETIATCALALLRLNRYDEAIAAARLVSGVTHERSVRANATLAASLLAHGQPAEAEALASASLADIESLSPYVRRESHAACLSALVRARLAQERLDGPDSASRALARLRRVAGPSPATRPVALLEEAALLDAWGTAGAADEVERLARQARALAPGYTLWRLAQPDAPPTTMTGYLSDGLRSQAARAPSPEAVEALLRQVRPAMQPRPPALSSSTALAAQIVTVAATLALLAIWMLTFFVFSAP
jgi:tetratricopeptide (TPR) repeat protein